MSKHQWPRVRKRTTKVQGKNYTYWVVDCGMVDGKRRTFNFKTNREAELKAERLRRERKRIGIDAIRLSDQKRADAVTALRKLDGDATLTEAVDFYLLHHNPTGGQRTVSELLEEYLDAKQKANRRMRTIQDIRYRIGRFAQEFGDTPVHQINTRMLEEWLDKHGYRKVTRTNFKTAFSGFFNFAMKRSLVVRNPASNIERPVMDEKIPEIFTPAEAEKLMRAAEKYDPRMAAYFAIALFAGIRPTEIQQLGWEHIDLSARRIKVIPETAKKRRQRYVDISDNLRAWLTPVEQESGLVHFSRKGFELVRRKGKITWAHDICRHSYGSYHLAMYDNPALTSMQMGHYDTEVLFRHYRDLVSREDARAFWSIEPKA